MHDMPARHLRSALASVTAAQVGWQAGLDGLAHAIQKSALTNQHRSRLAQGRALHGRRRWRRAHHTRSWKSRLHWSGPGSGRSAPFRTQTTFPVARAPSSGGRRWRGSPSRAAGAARSPLASRTQSSLQTPTTPAAAQHRGDYARAHPLVATAQSVAVSGHSAGLALVGLATRGAFRTHSCTHAWLGTGIQHGGKPVRDDSITPSHTHIRTGRAATGFRHEREHYHRTRLPLGLWPRRSSGVAKALYGYG